MPKINNLIEIMAMLRHPENGCPWDIEQTFDTIVPYTLEEAYEVADAIHAKDMNALRDELGDLLFQVVFHSRMAEEAGDFSFDDVVAGICDKMERRHPHVFGDESVESAEEQTRAWEKLKAEERQHHRSVLDGIAVALPALARAEKLQKKAARVGFDWPDIEGPIAKCHEELEEIKEALVGGKQEEIEAEIGDLLFAIVNLARFAQVDAESALRGANQRFTNRFQYIERSLEAEGKRCEEVDLDRLEALWEAAKRDERSGT